jgi:hypothetical protein
MKNKLLTLCFMLAVTFGFSQVKVFTNGFTTIGSNDAGAQRQLHVSTVGKGTGAVNRNEADANFDAKYEFWEDGIEYYEFGLKGNTAGDPFRIGAPNIGNANTVIEITQAGNMGVGRLTPSLKFEVGGNAGKTQGGNVWNVISDKRLKSNIQEYNDGLDAIMKIRPVTFVYNDNVDKSGRTEIGVVAQEIQEIAPYMVETFTLTEWEENYDEDAEEVIKSQNEYLSYNGNALQYMLVNAIQEQQQIIEDQQKVIEKFENKLDQLRNEFLTILEGGNSGIFNTNINLAYSDLAAMEQNAPNPFNGQTRIDYTLPTEYNSAKIEIYDLSGRILKTVNLNHAGEGMLTVNADNFPSGTYSYSLIVDGQRVETRKMQLSK